MTSGTASIRESGMTMLELVMAVGLTGIVLIIAAGVYLMSVQQNTYLKQSIDTEVDEMRAVNLMSIVFGQALDLKFQGNVSLNAYSGVSDGAMREFDSDSSFGTPPTVQTLAVFWRDNRISQSGSGALASQPTKTAIYFQMPTPTTWGVLYLNMGNSGALTPTRSDQIFEGFTRLRILNVTTANDLSLGQVIGNPVTSFDVELTYRHFFGEPDPVVGRNFCPGSLVGTLPQCPPITAFRDVVRTIKIAARNNVIGYSPSIASGVRGARLFDLIHFYQPAFGGAFH